MSAAVESFGLKFFRINHSVNNLLKRAWGRVRKGPPEHWVAVVKPGRVIFELSGVSLEDAKGAMKRAAHKLPVKTKFVARNAVISSAAPMLEKLRTCKRATQLLNTQGGTET